MVEHLPVEVPTSLPAAVMERLRQGAREARGTMAAETGRALRRAFGAYQHWCADRGVPPLPSSPDAVADYVDHLASIPGRKAAGIQQAIWAIGTMHRLAQQPDPSRVDAVRLALKRMSRALGTKPHQAAPIGRDDVTMIIQATGKRLIDLRDLALLLVMRDLLARRSEVVALDIADIAYDQDGSGTAMIRRSKTDQHAEGAELYLSIGAVTYLRGWLDAAQIREGSIFRSINKGGSTGGRLQAAEVARILKRLVENSGLPEEIVRGISGHSCRVGMAQDLVVAGVDMVGVMQAGRWKSPTMPARYSSRLQAKRGAVARLYDAEAAQ